MRKLTLDVDALCVESFDTGAGAGRGTVRGNVAEVDSGGVVIRESDPWTCAGDLVSCGGSCDPTCNRSCNGTCEISCNGTCHDASCDTCLFVTCGGCPSQPPQWCG
ncbi:MAG TPA: hypothetical protein VM759_00915 [Longimicrobium sp.]|nr:hypothetical protein [Longimicrobium sp.]